MLANPWSSPRDVLTKRAMRVATVLKPWASVAGDLGKHFDDERIRLAMSFQTKYLGMSPFHAPSLFTILAFLEYEHGIFHAKGGLGSITARMGEIAEEMGVEIRLSTPVKSLIYEGKTVTGVRIDGAELMADKVVVNADFAHAMTTLVPDEKRKKWSNKKLEKKGYSCSTYMLYLGVDKQYDLPHHQIYASSEYENNLKDITNHRLTWDDTLQSTFRMLQSPMIRSPRMDTPQSTCSYLCPTSTRASFGMTSKQISEKPSSSNFRSLATMTLATTLSLRPSSLQTTGAPLISTVAQCSTSPTISSKCYGAVLTTDSRRRTTSTSSVVALTQAVAFLPSLKAHESAASSSLQTLACDLIGTELILGSKT